MLLLLTLCTFLLLLVLFLPVLSVRSFVLLRAWQQEHSCLHVGRKHFQIIEIKARKISIVNSLPQGETGSGQKKPRSYGQHVDHNHIGYH